ncbi:MAG: Uma2 family endonuclease [Actinomycetota bacterium]|jgi:Uma2 family endonuclease
MTSGDAPAGGATLADLEAMPTNDGKRYELVDGHIIVSPWPSHYGGVSFHLGPILAHAVPPGHASYRLCRLDLPGEQRVIPDLMVAPHTSVGDQGVRTPVLLIVEVLCGLGDEDMARKRAAYAAAEVPAYWLIDADPPLATCMKLEGGEYQVYAEGPVVEVDWPLAVTVDVAEVSRPQGASR